MKEQELIQAGFEEWFQAVELGDGDIPLPTPADKELWDAYVLRHSLALGAWIAASTPLLERIAELEKDAARYRYWRDNHGWSGYFDDGATNSEDANDIDKAIDTALQHKEQT
jgi:hypothetical protein